MGAGIVRGKLRARKLKPIGRKRSKRFMDDEIEDWMIGQPLDPDKE